MRNPKDGFPKRDNDRKNELRDLLCLRVLTDVEMEEVVMDWGELLFYQAMTHFCDAQDPSAVWWFVTNTAEQAHYNRIAYIAALEAQGRLRIYANRFGGNP